jgi:hypothetical protein
VIYNKYYIFIQLKSVFYFYITSSGNTVAEHSLIISRSRVQFHPPYIFNENGLLLQPENIAKYLFNGSFTLVTFVSETAVDSDM